MSKLFSKFDPNRCCLCGNSQNLTGEHKLKAAILRKEFGTSQLVIGCHEYPDGRFKLAQSVKSKAFHFEAKVCATCNNQRTQAADKEFDIFHEKVMGHVLRGESPKQVFKDLRYSQRQQEYLAIFRYFAKLLCCHLASMGAPIPVQMSEFAIGAIHQNCVWVDIDFDWGYQDGVKTIGKEHSYAAHGGLVAIINSTIKSPVKFYSTLSFGTIRYTFFYEMIRDELIELNLEYQEFCRWCVEQAQKPISRSDLLKLGFEKETS